MCVCLCPSSSSNVPIISPPRRTMTFWRDWPCSLTGKKTASNQISSLFWTHLEHRDNEVWRIICSWAAQNRRLTSAEAIAISSHLHTLVSLPLSLPLPLLLFALVSWCCQTRLKWKNRKRSKPFKHHQSRKHTWQLWLKLTDANFMSTTGSSGKC